MKTQTLTNKRKIDHTVISAITIISFSIKEQTQPYKVLLISCYFVNE